MFSIFGTAFNPATGRWQAFNDEALTVLSEHATEQAALSACRRYTECQMRQAATRATTRSRRRALCSSLSLIARSSGPGQDPGRASCLVVES
jgi:hypothetical protein